MSNIQANSSKDIYEQSEDEWTIEDEEYVIIEPNSANSMKRFSERQMKDFAEFMNQFPPNLQQGDDVVSSLTSE